MGSAREVSVMSRYIDADAMKEWIDEYVSVFKKSDNKDIKGYIEHQPTIEAVPKEFHDKTCEAMAKRHQEEIADMVRIADRPQGEWINKHEWANGFYERECSICGAMKPILMHTAKVNYCPNCGAKMKGADDE